MWIYIRENFKKNSSKFLFIILIFFVTMLLLTFSLGVIYTINYRIENELADYLLKKDFKNMKLFLQLGTGVLVGFSLFIIYNTYSIVIQGRKKEFQLLYKLGMKYKKNSADFKYWKLSAKFCYSRYWTFHRHSVFKSIFV